MNNSKWVKTKPVIAIDGPAASGKGSLTRNLAKELGFSCLDTGKIYRALGKKVLAAQAETDDKQSILNLIGSLKLADFNDPDLTSVENGKVASQLAAIGWVREALVDLQRKMAYEPVFESGKEAPGAILDGRDIGTVITPDADLKIFVTAELETRVDRRYAELVSKGKDIHRDEVRQDLMKRDDRDKNRDCAPLIYDESYIQLDSTNLTIEEMVNIAKIAFEKSQSKKD